MSAFGEFCTTVCALLFVVYLLVVSIAFFEYESISPDFWSCTKTELTKEEPPRQELCLQWTYAGGKK